MIRKHFKLVLISTLAIILFGFILVNSTTQLTERHQRVLLMLAEFKNLRAAVDTKVLKARASPYFSYDGIVADEQALAETCVSLRDPNVGIHQKNQSWISLFLTTVIWLTSP